MKIILAKSAGFCFGVQRAVDMVKEQINIGKMPLYTYGPIIHNEEVVRDFESHGVQVMEEDRMSDYAPGTVIIRSHGVARYVEESLNTLGFDIIDATCPFVKKIHKAVDEHSKSGEHIIIIGNPDHPEVKGIVGWVNGNDYSVVPDRLTAENLTVNSDKQICIVSQTTFNHNKFEDIVEILESNYYNVNVMNTICNATLKRQTEAEELSKRADVMIVIGDRHSSNSRKLYEICEKRCPLTYFIETLDDLNLDVPKSVRLVGITAGASTPQKIIEEVQKEWKN